jgi:hypothetical protein
MVSAGGFMQLFCHRGLERPRFRYEAEESNAEEYDMHHTTKVLTVALLSGLLTLCAAAGCAGHTTKTAQTTTTESFPAADTDEMQPPRPVQRTTTATTAESDNSSPGIAGSAFQLVWAVISSPFRVVGALL